MFFPKLWNINNTKGIAINPENETALANAKYSLINTFWFLNIICKNTKKNSETNITEIIFVRRSLKDLFSIRYSFKNSTGINKTKREIKNVISDQNRPWPLQLINNWDTNPEDSRNK